MNAFKEIGYTGVMSIEYAHGSIPECLAQDFIDLSYKSAHYIWQL